MMYDQKTQHSTARALFSQFKVYFLTDQQRANGCLRQQDFLQKMRMLPKQYPTQAKWTQDEKRIFRPLTGELLVHLTHQLTPEDVMQDALWSEKSVILVTGNADRAALNASMAQVIAKKTGHLLIRWRKPISTADDNIDRIQDLLYDEDHRPMLFGYFLKNAIGQVLDNSNGNVSMAVANGSACLYHSVAWDEPTRTAVVLDLIEKASGNTNRSSSCRFLPIS
jgi:hypothetical protein